MADGVTDGMGWLIGMVDQGLMALYLHARSNARRLTRLGLALLPLMMLLVGSCKVEEVSDNFAGQGQTAQLRAALFPDRAVAQGEYHPAGGYVARALKFVEGRPDALTRLTDREIGFLYGRPTTERKDADARVWQYKTSACVVDFFFYDDARDGNDESPVSFVDYRLRQDLDPESAPREEPVPDIGRTRCLKKIAGGAQPSTRG
jgi:hypothetical protein